MATAYLTDYVTFGGLILASRAIDCTDWDDLLGTADHKGDPLWPLPGVDGGDPLDQFEDGLRAALILNISGRWTQDNVAVSGTAARRTKLHEHLAAIRAVAKLGTNQSLVITRAGFVDVTVDAKVVSAFRPRRLDFDMYRGSLDLLLPAGTPL